MKVKLIPLILMAMTFFMGCGPKLTIFQKSVYAYREGMYSQSEALLKEYVNQNKVKNDPNYPLMLLTLADTQFRLGDYQNALKTYEAAVVNMTVELSEMKTATQLFKREMRTLYRGKPHNLAFAHYYMGICYIQMEDYESARIEFAQALLEDKGEEAGQENDIVSAHFMEGLCYKRMGNNDEAAISFRKVTDLVPDFPYGWYELSIVLDKMGDVNEADQCWEKYVDIVPENQRLERADDVTCIFLIADLGAGPYKKADILVGQFTAYKKSSYPESWLDVAINRQNSGFAFKSDDLYFQAKTEGGTSGEIAKKSASVAAKTTLKAGLSVFGLGGLAPKSEADVRVWYTLPGEIYMCMIPAEPGQYTVTVNFYTEQKKQKVPLEAYRQNWHYVLARKHSTVKPLYLAAVYQLHNLNVNHQQINPKYKPTVFMTSRTIVLPPLKQDIFRQLFV